MKRLHVLLRRASVFRVALLLAGASLGPMCWADSITIPTGPFCEDCTITNITFYNVADVDSWAADVRRESSYVSNSIPFLRSTINVIRTRANNVSNYTHNLISILNANDGEGQFVYDALYYAQQIQHDISGQWGGSSGILGRCDVVDNELDTMESSIVSLYSYLDTTVPSYRAQFATMCEQTASSGGSGSCSCSCPDYTEYIDEIEDYLDDIVVSVSNIESRVASISGQLEHLRVILVGFRLDMAQSKSLWEDQTQYLYYLVMMALNSLDSSDRVLGNGTADPEEAGSRTGAYLGYFLSSQYNKNYIVTNMLARFATRDWWNWSGSMYSAPNYADFVDFVSLGMQGVTGLVMPEDDSSAWPIVNSWRDFYYNRNVHPTNEITNPLWVAFTNSVKLDPSLLDSNRLKISVDAYSSSSLDSLANMLTNLVLSVTMVTNNVTVDVQNEFDTSVDILDEEMGETSDVDQDSIQMPTANVSFSGIGSVVSRVVNSYSSMFSVIPDEPPSDIVVYKGHSYHLPGQSEDFEVESIHWSPFASSRDGESPESYVLNSIRLCFRFAWTVLYVILIYAATAVDLAVVGICAYAVWGVLMGRTDAMVKGFFYCFNVVRRLLGV